MNYIETNTMTFDELIGGTSITPLLFIRKVTAAGAGTIKKGTLLSEGSNGKFTVTPAPTTTTVDEQEVTTYGIAAAILAEDIVATAAGDINGKIYVRGIFNKEKLIAATNDTVAAHEAELRKVGIYMTSLK